MRPSTYPGIASATESLMPSRRCSGESTRNNPPNDLAADALFALVVDDDHALAGIGDLGRGDQPRQSGADHDDIGLLSHCSFPGNARD